MPRPRSQLMVWCTSLLWPWPTSVTTHCKLWAGLLNASGGYLTHVLTFPLMILAHTLAMPTMTCRVVLRVKCRNIQQEEVCPSAGYLPSLWRCESTPLARSVPQHFKVFNIHECIWVTVAALHLDDITGDWYQAYRLRQPVGDWFKVMNFAGENFNSKDSQTYDRFKR